MNTASYALGHLALRVSNLARARAFYVDTLHFTPLLEVPGRVLLNVHGLVIALVGDDPNTEQGDRFSPYRVGLDHLALAVPDQQELATLLEYLTQAGVPNHGIEEDEMTHARYISFYDPDGIAWEFYASPQR
ncbi:VOC family protein [Dictyobacter kobayashii]|uniref:Glyoxalase n=1 Tax=Dictyobacter kobayashii TaxID=2014872 RepID=A0A402AQU3_9CHLR|nr:VOC family protein [Dictyobacter kobayashii]GCE21463.1 glyoxalase [Dictyobacter kobayashii]